MSASDSLFGYFFSWSNAQGDASYSSGDDDASPASSAAGDGAVSPDPAPDDELRKIRKRLRNGFYRSERIRSFIARCLSFDLVPFSPDLSAPDEPDRSE
ncbi:MAG: hypothetical protein GVY18_10600 [Bacteroidetes bacterium]|nr:hypothetical protein [Bacteroidota bacterium]